MPELDFNAIVEQICKEDPRFDRKAYTFLRQGLDHTVKELKRKEAAAKGSKEGKSHHVSGAELLEGLRVYALDQYGPLAITVLTAWGVKQCSHFGDMVFNLIEYGVFSKTDSDRREDFSEVFTFEDAFVKPFQPAKKVSVASVEDTSAES